MQFKKDQKVNVTATKDQLQRLGITDLKNPCTVNSFYENGTDGYYLKDSEGKVKAIPEKLNALELAE